MLSLQVLLLRLSFPFLFSFYVRHAGSSSRENSASPTDCSYFEGTTASYTPTFYFPAKAERSLFLVDLSQKMFHQLYLCLFFILI